LSTCRAWEKYKILFGKYEERGHSWDAGIDGGIILNWISRNKVARGRIEFIEMTIWSNGWML
jgi:hypothetical protein